MSQLTRTLAGVEVPDTAIVKEAISYARANQDDELYNHVMRSWLYGLVIASKIPPLQNLDKEVHAVSAILHDLGLYSGSEFQSKDKRFEVDGAFAARKWLIEKANWDQNRVQLVWDAIALHTTASIFQHKQAEVAACGFGIFGDVAGPDAVPGGLLSMEEFKNIAKEFPRTNFHEKLKHHLCDLCRTKPDTTYDNFVSEFGEKYVNNYSTEGHKVVDIFEKAKGLDSV